jgi:hypothetical protein
MAKLPLYEMVARFVGWVFRTCLAVGASTGAIGRTASANSRCSGFPESLVFKAAFRQLRTHLSPFTSAA